MKVVPTIIALLLPILAVAECVTVQPLVELPPSKKVRLVALVGGKPLPNASIELVQNGPQPLAVLRTNRHGVAKLPALKPGFYSVLAASENQSRYRMDVHVLDKAKDQTGTFLLELQTAVVPSEDEVPTSGGRVEVTERIQSFKGIVQDPSGAAVPRAVIRVFAKGVKSPVVLLKTDESGNFSSHLAEGSYTVVVRSQGFKTFIMGLQVAPNGEAKELEVPLKIGSGC